MIPGICSRLDTDMEHPQGSLPIGNVLRPWQEQEEKEEGWEWGWEWERARLGAAMLCSKLEKGNQGLRRLNPLGS